MFAQKLLPALAVFGAAAAQSASVCSQATATVNSAADATALANCATIAGSVLIGPNASGSIQLDGPQQITGDLICTDAGILTSLSSSTIGTIGGSFTLNNLTLLSTLGMSTLKSVKTINWSALPALSQLSFTAVVTKATSVTIQNTFLTSLDGINLQSVATLDVNNNNRLKTFSTQLANVTSLLSIASNGQFLDLQFPNLVWAANVTFRNASSVSIPSLAVVNGSMGFYGNYLTSISAPNLTSVGYTAQNNRQGSLAIVANSKLENISMPLLSTVGGAFQIANNTALSSALNFPALTQVSGAIDFSGNFKTPTMPQLQNVNGGFNIQSTAQIDCSTFDKQKGGIIQGTYTCKTTTDVQSGVGSGSSTTSGTSSSSTSKAAAVSYGVSEAAAGLSVLGGILGMLL